MSLTQLEQYVFAEYVADEASALNITERAYPYGELLIVIEDKVQFSVRKHGLKRSPAAKAVATAFVDLLIERQALSSVKQNLGGTMHKLDKEAYRQLLAELRASNPIILEAQKAGPDFWRAAFERLAA